MSKVKIELSKRQAKLIKSILDNGGKNTRTDVKSALNSREENVIYNILSELTLDQLAAIENPKIGGVVESVFRALVPALLADGRNLKLLMSAFKGVNARILRQLAGERWEELKAEIDYEEEDDDDLY